MIQSQTPIVCISNSRQSCLSDGRIVNGMELSSCICISTDNSDSICTSQDLTVSVQNSSYCSSLAPMSVVFRGVTTISISSNFSYALFKTTDTSKRKVLTSKSPITRLRELSNNQLDIKSFRKALQTLSQNQDEHLLRKSDSKWVVYSNWCHRKKVNPVAAPLTVIADFLIMPPTSKKLEGHIASGVFVRLFVTLFDA